MSVVGLDHVQIAAPCGCEPEARRFYGELLGLPEIEKPEPLADRLIAAGETVRWDEALPDQRRFYAEDPWGNRLELLATARTSSRGSPS